MKIKLFLATILIGFVTNLNAEKYEFPIGVLITNFSALDRFLIISTDNNEPFLLGIPPEKSLFIEQISGSGFDYTDINKRVSTGISRAGSKETSAVICQVGKKGIVSGLKGMISEKEKKDGKRPRGSLPRVDDSVIRLLLDYRSITVTFDESHQDSETLSKSNQPEQDNPITRP